MAEQTSAISEIILKLLLFLGIFAVAAKEGKHEYTFEVGNNLFIVLLATVVLYAIIRVSENKFVQVPAK